MGGIDTNFTPSYFVKIKEDLIASVSYVVWVQELVSLGVSACVSDMHLEMGAKRGG